ncbi:PucR family transcriptional regulator, partial [Streptomyces sp. SID7499]|nr:PucR family transcriptional regulator [Streptomyces sp. SID7499]
ERTEELLLLPARELIDASARRCLAPLDGLSPTQARRLAETLLAWIETPGGAPEVAARLGIHPQTARYRLRQIRELWGDAIDEPDQRFEM